ncbi:MAG: 2TM domain-containing protein [Thaumarchaeota archaeon]|nr:2TM domain-containing protein [Candidatus Geocrenenecus arthurdayi]
MSIEVTLEEFLEAWKEYEIKEALKGFQSHLAAYIIVNAFLIFVNLWTSPGTIWFIWPLAGWAIGLAFHGYFSRPKQVIDSIEKKQSYILRMVSKKKTTS